MDKSIGIINVKGVDYNLVDKVTRNQLPELTEKIDNLDQTVYEKVTKIVENAPEDFDTLKEISDWIDTHEDSASAMNSAINQNKTAINNLKNYSSTEVEIGTWIDNKKLYRKCIRCELTNKGGNDISLSTDFSELVNISGSISVFNSSGYFASYPLEKVDNESVAYQIYYRISNSSINIYIGESNGGTKYIVNVILEYTKDN